MVVQVIDFPARHVLVRQYQAGARQRLPQCFDQRECDTMVRYTDAYGTFLVLLQVPGYVGSRREKECVGAGSQGSDHPERRIIHAGVRADLTQVATD